MKVCQTIVFCGFFVLQLKCSESLPEVASFKPSRQAGTYQDNATEYGANKAVDNSITTYAFIESKKEGVAAWWQVDLKDTYVVWNLVLTASFSDFEYMATFEITVDETYATNSTAVCLTYNNQSVLSRFKEIYIECRQPKVGRYVTIRRFGDIMAAYLTLAEVQVFAENFQGNRALFKQTWQSNEYKDYADYYAVDDEPNSCSMSDTGSDSDPAWWQVDMVGLYAVSMVTITISDGHEEFSKEEAHRYLNGTEITIDETNTTHSSNICNVYNNGSGVTPNVPLVISCNQSLKGRYVTIRRLSDGYQPSKLALCNVEVLGEYAGEPAATPDWAVDPSNLTSPPTLTSVAAAQVPTDSGSCSPGSCSENKEVLSYSDIVAIVVGGAFGLILISAMLAVCIFYTCIKSNRKTRL